MGFVAREIQEKRKNIDFLIFYARFAGEKMKNRRTHVLGLSCSSKIIIIII